jgi:hypothetical protein
VTDTGKAVQRLTDLTRKGKLVWSETSTLRSRREAVVGKVYTATYEGDRFAVYESRYKYYLDEDVWEWQPQVNIELIDEEGTLDWAWPENPEGWQLLEAVRFASSGAAKVLRKLAGEDK